MNAQIFIDDRELQRLNQLMQQYPQIFQAACKSALRRAGANMRTNIGRGMRKISYLKGSALTGSIGRLQMSEGDMQASVKVQGARLPADRFRLLPKRVTARKGVRSVNWPEPRFSLGPGLAPRYAERDGGRSKAFIIKSGRMYQRKGKDGLRLAWAVVPQYFAVFDAVEQLVLAGAHDTFLQRLEHEIDYRLGPGR